MSMATNPPERRTVTCHTCDGAGDYILYEYGELTHDGECNTCEGSGQVSVHEAAEYGVPDNWMDLV